MVYVFIEEKFKKHQRSILIQKGSKNDIPLDLGPNIIDLHILSEVGLWQQIFLCVYVAQATTNKMINLYYYFTWALQLSLTCTIHTKYPNMYIF